MLILRQSAFSITLDRSRWQKKAREFSMHLSGCIETIADRDHSMIRSLRNWDKPFDRCISLANVTNVSYVRLSSRRNHRSSRRERKKSTDRHLLKHTDTEEICRSRWLSERILCSLVKPLTWDIHMTMCGKIRYRLAQTTTNGTRNSELNKGGTKTRLCSSFFAPSFLENAMQSLFIKTSHYWFLALSGSGNDAF